MKKFWISVLTAALLSATPLVSTSALADDDERQYQHFKPEPAENLQQAIMNLSKYNAMLEEIVNGDLSAEDMAKVHELTYTLEVALARLSKELDVATNSLEEVHLGSEQMNQQRVKGFGKDYLKTLNHLLGEHMEHHSSHHSKD
ncbi:hypothetical protein DEU29_1229 [Idiomarina aquatica]|uniref:Cytochrome b562 n=1 Tax=Idiomarina aquatica TaxID=1327752 RepID=A0A4R6NYS6_9GAMM|nr:DUF6746 family protein [Idiomarina aquatica]TDP28364.1 hypothetical protein DEU29_1229 [Idiomarina aquatica]